MGVECGPGICHCHSSALIRRLYNIRHLKGCLWIETGQTPEEIPGLGGVRNGPSSRLFWRGEAGGKSPLLPPVRPDKALRRFL